MKKTTAIALAAIILIGNLFIHTNSYAESADDLENIQEKRSDLKDDLSEAEEKSRELISDIQDLNKEMEQRHAELKEKEALIDQTEQNIADTVRDIQSLQDDIKELESNIEKRSDLLKERLASYQKSGGAIHFLDVIFGADSFSDLISRMTMVTKITNSDAALVEQFEEETKQVSEKQKQAMDKLDDLNSMKTKQENALASIDEEKQKTEARMETLENKQQKLTLLADKLEKEDSDLASLEKETRQNIAAAAEAKAKEEAKKKQSRKAVRHEKTINPKTEAEDKKETEPDTDTNGKTLTMTATAYTADASGGTGVTATGINLKENPDAKVIAVDPSVIPLGSVVHVEGYGYAIAGDTGGAIKGNKIDVFVPTHKDAVSWGVRTVQVTVQ